MTFDLSMLGWDTGFRTAYARYARPDRRPARVARVDRGVCTAIGADGPHRVTIGGGLLAAAVQDATRLPGTGDWVVVQAWPDGRATIEAVLPRRTAIVRAAAGKESLPQVLAANVDSVAVVAPLDPEPDPATVERLLAVAWESGAVPLVILSKVDLTPDPGPIRDEIAEIAPGVDVYAVSAETGHGLDALSPYVSAGRTLALLGPSGAGKSTVVNALVGATVMDTQAIRRSDGRGRHTTTFRSLVPLPGGGAVLDTPGLRSIGVYDGGLDLTFADIEALAMGCRFPNCQHAGEPDCEVWLAVENGELSHRRLESWRKLQRELVWQVRRREVRLR